MAGVASPERQDLVLEIELPPVSAHPFPLVCRPDYPQVEKEMNAWAWQHLRTLPGVSEDRVLRLAGQGFPLWISFAYPAASTATAIRIGRWMYYWFLLDDLASEPVEPGTDRPPPELLIAGLQDVIANPDTARPDPFSHLLQQQWHMMRDTMPVRQRARFTEYVLRMLDGFATSIDVSAAGSDITLDQYRDLRYFDSGMPWTFLLAEHTAGLDLPEAVLDHPAVRELISSSVWNAVLVNDVIAFGKEYFTGDDWNAVAIVMREDGTSIQEALNRVADLALAEERRIVALCDVVRAEAPGRPDDLRRFVEGLQHVLSGTVEWEYRSARYHGPGYVWTGRTSGPVAMTRAGTRSVDR
ncbi:terpene synthase family protein [Pseudonocardia sp. TRM90224]|uniref:terpene synthase family protein n=1 Tax=Pseudonocardia sp. TRM90224 TaxID=2812678 RepID=UPI001E4356AA|nr:terpene synthase family protein [Pseudonocardia sp. TRM90224]